MSVNTYLGRQSVAFSGSLSKGYKLLKYLRRAGDEAKTRFQYLRNGELADFFFNIKTSFSTPMMLWDKITITWSSCDVRWPLYLPPSIGLIGEGWWVREVQVTDKKQLQRITKLKQQNKTSTNKHKDEHKQVKKPLEHTSSKTLAAFWFAMVRKSTKPLPLPTKRIWWIKNKERREEWRRW